MGMDTEIASSCIAGRGVNLNHNQDMHRWPKTTLELQGEIPFHRPDWSIGQGVALVSRFVSSCLVLSAFARWGVIALVGVELTGWLAD